MHEYANFVRLDHFIDSFANPESEPFGFLVAVIKNPYLRIRSIENRNSSASVFFVAIHVPHERRQESVNSLTDLMRRPVIDFKGVGWVWVWYGKYRSLI